MTFLSHFMTFTILSPHKFTEVTENLMLITLPTETDLAGRAVQLNWSAACIQVAWPRLILLFLPRVMHPRGGKRTCKWPP
jgi:hypothetical protein